MAQTVPVLSATLAGTRKMPLPIIVPTQKATADQTPSRRGSGSARCSGSVATVVGSGRTELMDETSNMQKCWTTRFCEASHAEE
jgi:hypothetical protein